MWPCSGTGAGYTTVSYEGLLAASLFRGHLSSFLRIIPSSRNRSSQTCARDSAGVRLLWIMQMDWGWKGCLAIVHTSAAGPFPYPLLSPLSTFLPSAPVLDILYLIQWASQQLLAAMGMLWPFHQQTWPCTVTKCFVALLWNAHCTGLW